MNTRLDVTKGVLLGVYKELGWAKHYLEWFL